MTINIPEDDDDDDDAPLFISVKPNPMENHAPVLPKVESAMEICNALRVRDFYAIMMVLCT